MGLFDFLIGSGGSETTTTKNSIYTPEQEELLKTLTQQAQTGLDSGVTAYPGQMYVPQNKYETSYLSGVGGTDAQAKARSTAYQNLLSGTPAYTIDPAAREKYYNEAFYNPAMREYQTNILPQVLEAASGAGFHSSDTLNQMHKSAADLETNLAAKRAELLWGDVQAGRTAAENAMGRMATFAGSPTNIVTGANEQMGTAGAYARQIEQEKVVADLQRWLAGESVGGVRSDVYNPYNQLALAILGLTPYAFGEKTETEGPGLIPGLLGGMSSGIGQGIGAGIAKKLGKLF